VPVSIRKDGKAKRIALSILGPPQDGVVDSYGKKKRYRKMKEKNNAIEEKTNRFEEIGLYK